MSVDHEIGSLANLGPKSQQMLANAQQQQQINAQVAGWEQWRPMRP